MFQPGILGFCRNILLSYLPFIGSFVHLDPPVQAGNAVNSGISVLKTSSVSSNPRLIRTDYRPVRLFGKVVAVNFARGL
ncbi:MAG: hypothetical protein HY550_07000 [Elusimicrobia bacterium]|nr:hypothetical protein [Elusimicrobiota bacterium]